MTPKQKTSHIAQLETILVQNNFTLDRWNRYTNGNIMVDTRKSNNIQVFYNKQKKLSKPFVNVAILDFDAYIKRILQLF